MKFLAYMLVFIMGLSLLGCKETVKPEDKDTRSVVMRQEDATYQVAGENPLSPEYKKDLETKKKVAEGKLIVKDIKVGTGVAVKDGDTVSVHYKGWLDDGKDE